MEPGLFTKEELKAQIKYLKSKVFYYSDRIKYELYAEDIIHFSSLIDFLEYELKELNQELKEMEENENE